MDEDVLDRLVLQYLQKRGYTQAQQALCYDAQNLQTANMTLAPQVDPEKGIVEDLLLYLVADNNQAQYARSFDSFAIWVDNSLDLYKAELQKLLYPTFILCYLRLVKHGASAEAQQMLAKHRARFVGTAQRPAQARLQELQDLQNLSLPEQLESNQASKLFLILSIVNEHLSLQIIEGQPSADAGDETDVGILSGQSMGIMSSVNQQELQLGLLQGNAEDRYAAIKADREAEAVPEADAEGKALSKKKRLALEKEAEKERSKRHKAAEGRLEPQIPLAPRSEVLDTAVLNDFENRMDVGPQALPSILFHTFVNTAQSLNCSAFAPDLQAVAGGFADSSVRLYNLNNATEASADGPEARQAGEPFACMHGHSASVHGIDWMPDGRCFLTSSSDGTLRIWSPELRRNLAVYRGHNLPVWDIAACPAGHYFASASNDRTVRVWCTDRVHAVRILTGAFSDADVVRWHPNSHYVAAGCSDRTIRIWDIRGGRLQRILTGHRAPITSLAFSPDGSMLLSGDAEGELMLWSLGQAKRLASFHDHRGPIWTLVFSHGLSNMLASGSADETVKLWSLSGQAAAGEDMEAALPAAAPELQRVKSFKTRAMPVFSLHWTPRNVLLASGPMDLRQKVLPA
ncbi:hypothetical protein WJX84_005823 [Apatococcus fuscideae]|uniref:Transcription initiation factor TFIID subunit 5 n=1 Tax=Apatococcus fuscideae TaxID=2026836 RepID=A0AAW1SYN1_9CHLO